MLLSSPVNPQGKPRHSESLHYKSCARRSDDTSDDTDARYSQGAQGIDMGHTETGSCQ